MITDDDELRGVLERTRTIAVVGASASPGKAAHDIPRYLRDQGYVVLPVNPGREEVLGVPAAEDLGGLDEHVDVVEVFRPAEEAPAIAREAVAIGADVLWLQVGIRSEEAARIADEAGLDVVMDRCMGMTHGRLGLGPGPH